MAGQVQVSILRGRIFLLDQEVGYKKSIFLYSNECAFSIIFRYIDAVASPRGCCTKLKVAPLRSFGWLATDAGANAAAAAPPIRPAEPSWLD